MADNVVPLTAARSRRTSKTAVPVGPPLAGFIDSWSLALEVNRSPATVRIYLTTAREFCAFLESQGLPTGVDAVEPAHVRAFLLDRMAATSPGYASIHFRNLRVWFTWLIKEGERTRPSPVDPADKPKVPERDFEPFSVEQIRALLKTCEKGSGFVDRRDTAILRVFADTGMRLSGLAGLRYHPEDEALSDVRLRERKLRIVLKGGRELWVPIGKKAGNALDRYIRARARHSNADSPWLWLGTRGQGPERFTSSGVAQMLKRRGREAAVQNVHPHRFRRTMADQWFEQGGNVDDLMEIAGWKTISMPLHYAKNRRAVRARQAHERLSPGDRI